MIRDVIQTCLLDHTTYKKLYGKKLLIYEISIILRTCLKVI